MDKFDSFDNILDFAIEKEIEANQFYTDLASKMENPAMGEVFEAFAKEGWARFLKLLPRRNWDIRRSWKLSNKAKRFKQPQM
ncbi:MAG: ferritin family protein [Planctomycetota bacterium]